VALLGRWAEVQELNVVTDQPGRFPRYLADYPRTLAEAARLG